MEVKIKDNSKEVKKALYEATLRALEICGGKAEGYAKKLCPVDTGRLQNSITHAVNEQEQATYIGTNVEYAAYVELGTSKMREQPYLKPAAAEHSDEYRRVIENELKKG